MKSLDYLVAESGLGALLDFEGDAEIVEVYWKLDVRISFGPMCLFS